MSSQRSSMDSQDNIRKRVCKACDRCRLKKSKCDGASPCSRCKADNAICVFGERKKSHDKVYPKGYVEMLEQQQAQLVAGLRELYSRLQNGQGWPGQSLAEAQGGHPLTHDILERLDLLHPSDSSSHYEGFEEDCNRMQQRLLERGAVYTHRRGSISSDSEHGLGSASSHSGTPTTKAVPFSDPFARNNAPPTPPMHSPFPRQSQLVSPVKTEVPMFSSATVMQPGLEPSTLSRPSWAAEPMVMDDTMDFKYMPSFDALNNYDSGAMLMDPYAVNPSASIMPDWNDPNELDFNNFINPIST